MLCIIQSRISSIRLPGKMLMDLNGETLLGRVINSVRSAKKVNKLVVATSINKEDDVISDYCKRLKIKCYRGNLKNVFERFLHVIANEKADSFIRISGDSPIIPGVIIDKAITHFENNYCDLVTNIFPRTFPKGFSVEAIRSETFKKVNYKKLTDDQLEHITKIFYDKPHEFKIQNFTSKTDYSHLNFSVDTLKDLSKIKDLLCKNGSELIYWEELCEKYSEF
mgnify:CR=1 FL=1